MGNTDTKWATFRYETRAKQCPETSGAMVYDENIHLFNIYGDNADELAQRVVDALNRVAKLAHEEVYQKLNDSQGGADD